MRLPRSTTAPRSASHAVAAACALAVAACGRVGYTPLTDATVAPDSAPPDATIDGAVPDDAPVQDVPTPVDADAGADAGADADAGVVTCPARASTDYCFQVPALPPTAPVIDGEVDCGLMLRRVNPVDWTGALPIPASHWSELAVGWHRDGLYFFVQVHDGTTRRPVPESVPPYCGESIEVYFDSDALYSRAPDYDVPGSLQWIARAPAMGVPRTSSGTMYSTSTLLGAWSSMTYATFAKPDGYALEAFVRISDLTSADAGVAAGTLAAGRRVGLNVAVNLPLVGTTDGGACPRLGQYFLRSFPGQPPPCRGLPFCDVRAFCGATLMAP